MFTSTAPRRRGALRRCALLLALLALPLSGLPAPAPANAGAGLAAAAAPQVAILSVDEGGQQGPYGDSGHASISADGSAVVFHSYQSLTADDTNATSDIYVRDLASASIARVAPLHESFSHPRANASLYPEISADGRYIAFQANLVDAGKPCQIGTQDWNVYLFDRLTSNLICASAAAGGAPGNHSSSQAALAGGGGSIAFASTSTNFTLLNLPAGDLNGKQDIIVADIQRNAKGEPIGASLRIILGPGGAQSNGTSAHPDISADGQVVVFDSLASNLSPEDADTVSDVYRYDRGAGSLEVLSATLPSSASYPVVSANGRYVAFQAATGAGTSDVFVYDAVTKLRARVSLGVDGLPVDGSGPAISPDGQYVSFSAAGAAGSSLLVYDRGAGASHLASAAYGGGVADGYSSGPSLALADGLRIAFTSSAENLLPSEPYPGSRVSDVFLATFPLVATIAAGNGQRAALNQPFAQALAVRVSTALGSPVAGVAVTFTAPEAGPGGSFPGPARSAVALSDALGVARAPQLTANGTAGTFSVLATAGDAGALAFQLTSGASTNPCDAPGLAPRLVPWQGGRWYLSGVNVPWQSGGYGSDFATVEEWGQHTYTHAATEAMFAALEAKGVNSVRWWVFADGRGGPEFSADAGGAVTGLDAGTLPSMADAVALAAAHDIYLVFNLWSFELLEADHTSAAGDKGQHAGGHRDLIVDAAKRSSFITNALLPMLAYPVPGTSYTIGTHPNVLGWDIFNEPEWAISGPQANGAIPQPVSLAEMQRFVAEITSAIHRNSDQLVTVGSASLKWNSATRGEGNWWSDAALTAYAADGALDFYQVHYYEWMDGDSTWSYSPLKVSRAAAGLDKPTIVGEIPALMGGKTLGAFLDGTYAGCYGGAWAWSYAGVDAAGGWPDIAGPIGLFNAAHAGEVDIVAPQWSPAAPTATGSMVGVTPLAGVGVTFETVSAAGGTAVLVGDGSATPLGEAYEFGAEPQVYDVITTADYAGEIRVEIAYDEGLFSDESRLRLLHNEAGAWVDRTASLDLATNRVVAVVGGLSEFALVELRNRRYLPVVLTR